MVTNLRPLDPPLIRPASNTGAGVYRRASDVTVTLMPRWRPVALHPPPALMGADGGLC